MDLSIRSALVRGRREHVTARNAVAYAVRPQQSRCWKRELFGRNRLSRYSTFRSGSFSDRGKSVAMDADGSVYVAEITGSPSVDFPRSERLNGEYAGGWDLFVAKLSPSGDRLIYLTDFEVFLSETSSSNA